ncbi:MAG TPA: YEATS-associated helix-containing protein [Marinospirillum sp.]|uniref:YEATS-associated helix-containing protein n=1 Tax=Marinospirillum sp. TaxID=2183934 RepID=UPI002B477CBA|nr:YEATS-associated helix-containing protein [Marinospirillum sp.]HKM14393.1 YEATS-associated helix-containing protein [Marinospirillum sp.]
MVGFVIVLTFVMLIAGVFGGLVNFYLLNQNNRDTTGMVRCVVVGVGASFLVPVLLDLVGSSIVVQSQNDPSQLLIYTGLCLIAAIASRVVVTNKLDRTLQAADIAKLEVEDLRIQVKQLQITLLPLIETETEMDVVREEDNDSLDSLDVAATQVLKALGSGRYIFRTQDSLLKDLELADNDVIKSLSVLMSKGLTGKVNSSWGLRWHLTERGRRLAESSV